MDPSPIRNHYPLYRILPRKTAGRIFPRLKEAPTDGNHCPRWQADGCGIAPGSAVGAVDANRGCRLYVLDNLLPDGVETRRRIADRVKAEGLEPFHLLAKIGRDCVGALQFLPADVPPPSPGQVDVDAIDDGRICAILRSLNRVPLGLSDDDGFRLSIAGAQNKTALTLVEGQWCLPLGSTATTHILKPAIGVLGNGWDFSRSVENEWFCLGFLRRFGLATPDADIRRFDGETALVVERFDRRWTQDGRLLRVPQEDLLQAIGLPRTQKYEVDGGPTLAEVMAVLRASDHPDEDCAALFKAKILYWLLAATDCHAKNASLFIRPQGGFRLCPFYDVVSVQPNLDAGQVDDGLARMAVSVNGRARVEDIGHDDWLAEARRCGTSPAAVTDIIRSIVADAPMAAEAQLAALPTGFPEDLAASIIGGFLRRLKVIMAA
ncbi:MAG: HipA domain-containing protein [Pseudomonadota bacterium]